MRIALLCLGLVALAVSKSYVGYNVYHIYPTTAGHVHTMLGFMEDPELDFWTERTHLGEKTTVLMRSEYFQVVVEPVLHAAGIEYTLDPRDVQGNIDQERADRPETFVFNSNKYNSYEEIVTWMVGKQETCVNGHSEYVCSIETLGQSVEGRDMLLFAIKHNTPNRKAYWMDSLIHSREWLAGATLLKMMENFLEGYDTDTGVSSILSSYDMYFLPVMNPDGYYVTFLDESAGGDRLWRKNRAVNDGSPCLGVDLNRNYDYNWGKEGVSDTPCVEIFCGPSAGSEPETVAVQNKAAAIKDDVLGWWTIHASGEFWMWPWGNTYTFNGTAPLDCEIATDDDDMRWVGQQACDAASHVNNGAQDCSRVSTGWKSGTSCETIYPTTGATDDYVKGAHQIKYPICIEVTGNGFVVNATMIPYSYNEVWAGVQEMVDRIAVREGL